MDDAAVADWIAFMDKHNIQGAVLLVPIDDQNIHLQISNLSIEQAWMITDEITKQLAHSRGALNG